MAIFLGGGGKRICGLLRTVIFKVLSHFIRLYSQKRFIRQFDEFYNFSEVKSLLFLN